MSYKELFFVVAKILTISSELKNRNDIELLLKKKLIDWDSLVKISSGHYVLPSLYFNLKKVSFLKYIPNDLNTYLKYIFEINQNRNKQILIQVKELNNLLLSKNIKAVFLKGSGNLLAGLYDDIGERMIGDIDFIVQAKSFERTIEILKTHGYYTFDKTNKSTNDFRHYSPLVKKNNIAAVEVHKELVIKKYIREFNYNFIEKDSMCIDNINVLSFANKLNMSIVSNQINDFQFYYKLINLRNAYDVFLLSKKTDSLKAISSLNGLRTPLNCFLFACYEIFNKVDTLKFKKTKNALKYNRLFKKQLHNNLYTKLRFSIVNLYIFIRLRTSFLFKSIIYKDYRVLLLIRIKNLFSGRSFLKF